MRASSALFLPSDAEKVLIILRAETSRRKNGLLATDRGADGGSLFMLRTVHATRDMRVREVIMVICG